MLNLMNRRTRPNRVVKLKTTDDRGVVKIVHLRPGDTLEVFHTIDGVDNPNIELRLRAKAATIELA